MTKMPDGRRSRAPGMPKCSATIPAVAIFAGVAGEVAAGVEERDHPEKPVGDEDVIAVLSGGMDGGDFAFDELSDDA